MDNPYLLSEVRMRCQGLARRSLFLPSSSNTFRAGGGIRHAGQGYDICGVGYRRHHGHWSLTQVGLPPLFESCSRSISTCEHVQHVCNSTVAVRRGQSNIVPFFQEHATVIPLG